MRFVWILILITVALLVAGNRPDTSAVNLAEGMDAPAFYLKDFNGNDVFLRDYCGDALRQPWKNKTHHVVVLSFFATWCVPCQHEIPLLEKLSEKYADKDIKFFLVDVGEKADILGPYLKKKGFKIPVLMDIYKMVSGERYGVTTLPRLFVIDKQGKIALIKVGFKDEESFHHSLIPVIDKALAEGE